MAKAPEFWLRGDVPRIPPLLQPVAHSLLQAQEEVRDAMDGFPAALLWERPADLASVGFHLQHLAGVLDRLFSYARGDALTAEQLVALRAEGVPASASVEGLLRAFERAVSSALFQLEGTGEQSLRDVREVGRARLPSTVQGLLFHAAEHTMRHVGQLLVTARVVRAQLR
jgi:uncharacterized damage-inducible protein DinB